MSIPQKDILNEIRTKIHNLDNIDDLNIIRDIVRNQRSHIAKRNSFSLVKGDKVKIVGSKRGNDEGVIEKMNRTRAVVIINQMGWNVPFEMLRKINDE